MKIHAPKIEVCLGGLAMIFEGIVKFVSLGSIRPVWSFQVYFRFMK